MFFCKFSFFHDFTCLSEMGKNNDHFAQCLVSRSYNSIKKLKKYFFCKFSFFHDFTCLSEMGKNSDHFAQCLVSRSYNSIKKLNKFFFGKLVFFTILLAFLKWEKITI